MGEALRFADAANPGVLRELFKSSIGLYAIIAALYFGTLSWHDGFLFDLHYFIVGLDFVNLWFTGKLALYENPGQYYDADRYMQALNAALGVTYEPHFLSYPPTQFMLGMPFGLLPYTLAYPLWLALNVLALVCSVRPLGSRALFMLVLVSPAALIWLLCGQSSLITAALVITALRLMDTAPRKAGICIGLLIIKPQLALLFPLFLLLTRRWKTFTYAAITLLCLLALTVACLGIEPWLMYLKLGLPEVTANLVTTTDMVASLSPTLFNDLRRIGIASGSVFAVQWALSLLVVAGFALAIRRADALPYTLLLFTTASLLVTCYLLSYDLVPFSFALVYVAYTVPLTRRESILLVACFWLPLLVFFLKAYGIPGPSLLPVLLLATLLIGPSRRLRSLC